MMDLLNLAERVEALDGPCRETDALVYVAVTEDVDFEDALAINGEVGTWVPEYTASIDIAMTLVPPKMFEQVATGGGTKRSFAQLIWPRTPRYFSHWWRTRASIYVCAATPALALTAAALRALATTKEQS